MDGDGELIEGGTREAVRRGLVMEEIVWVWWCLEKKENGYVYDWNGTYDEQNVLYASLVDGVAVPVAEVLVVD